MRVCDNGEPLVELDFSRGVMVRAGLAERLHREVASLPPGLGLKVIEGHRRVGDQLAIIERYMAELRESYPLADDSEIARLSSRFVSPIEVAPHVAGATVDLTLIDELGAVDGVRR